MKHEIPQKVLSTINPKQVILWNMINNMVYYDCYVTYHHVNSSLVSNATFYFYPTRPLTNL